MSTVPPMKVSTSGLAHLTHNQRRWLLLGMLMFLHVLLFEGVESSVGRMLLVAHIGLFILWQPFVRAEQRLSAAQLAVIAAVVAGVAWGANVWLMILWTMALAGIVGGKVFFFAGRGTKLLYLLILAYLISLLLMVLVPRVLPAPYAPAMEFQWLALYALPFLFPLMALLPVEPESAGEAEVVDFVYSAFIFLLLAVLVLGSIASMLLIRRGYFESLVVTVIAFGAVLLVMAWAWNPRLGFTGFGMLFSRYMLSLGLPFERWLHALAGNMQREDKPEEFLARSLEAMVRLPWVNGCQWQVGAAEDTGAEREDEDPARTGAGHYGRRAGARSDFRRGPLAVSIYSQQPLSPALNWHFNLMVQLLGEFYEARLRAQELQQLGYVKAIHQTGARLTHDVKNLLQSLNALCRAAGEGDTHSPEYQALLRRQLPVIAQRLQQTLDKLRQPEQESVRLVPVVRWWAELQSRHAGVGARFAPLAADAHALVPAVLFNSVAENLIQNALVKRQLQAGLLIEVSLRVEEGVCLAVCDDGAPIPAEVARELLRAPVPSQSGLGIGLYQCARHAESFGYELKVAVNEPGRVCFELRRADGH